MYLRNACGLLLDKERWYNMKEMMVAKPSTMLPIIKTSESSLSVAAHFFPAISNALIRTKVITMGHQGLRCRLFIIFLFGSILDCFNYQTNYYQQR